MKVQPNLNTLQPTVSISEASVSRCNQSKHVDKLVLSPTSDLVICSCYSILQRLEYCRKSYPHADKSSVNCSFFFSWEESVREANGEVEVTKVMPIGHSRCLEHDITKTRMEQILSPSLPPSRKTHRTSIAMKISMYMCL